MLKYLSIPHQRASLTLLNFNSPLLLMRRGAVYDRLAGAARRLVNIGQKFAYSEKIQKKFFIDCFTYFGRGESFDAVLYPLVSSVVDGLPEPSFVHVVQRYGYDKTSTMAHERLKKLSISLGVMVRVRGYLGLEIKRVRPGTRNMSSYRVLICRSCRTTYDYQQVEDTLAICECGQKLIPMCLPKEVIPSPLAKHIGGLVCINCLRAVPSDYLLCEDSSHRGKGCPATTLVSAAAEARKPAYLITVSYTHLTLPTNREV